MSNDCPNRLVSCKWGCGIVDLFFKELAEHEGRECLLRRRACPLDCGEVMLGRRRHMRSEA